MYDRMNARMEAGETVLIDGAMGTELERRGVPMDDEAWAGTAMKTHPQAIRDIHREFIEAGCDVIITNTYAASKYVLAAAGLEAEFADMTRLACRLAQEAREEASAGRDVLVAGSMSTFPPGLKRDRRPGEREARAAYAEQARLLAGGGCDFIAMEMMVERQHSRWATEAALETGLPVWVGFSARIADDGRVVCLPPVDPAPLGETVELVMALGGDAAGIMHTDVADCAPALAELKRHWQGPAFAYPHSGEFEMPHWQFDTVIGPEAFAAESLRYVEMGASAIGGCCGIGPDHIAALRKALDAR